MLIRSLECLIDLEWKLRQTSQIKKQKKQKNKNKKGGQSAAVKLRQEART